MKILIMSWEYPPISYGGLARHVQDLSEALVKQGHQIYVITQGDGNITQDEVKKGVRIIRTNPVHISANNFIDDILHLNFLLLEKAFKLVQEIGSIDLIHGHDWLVFWTSKVLKHSLIKPLIFTIHATEYGRNQGIYNEMQRYINDLEWYSTFESWKVIVCSHYMSREIINLFHLPEDKVEVIANGVNEDNFSATFSMSLRKKYASSDEKIVLYIGRLVREKGIQVLIQAIPEILLVEPKTKFIIAGRGSYLEQIKVLAAHLGVEDNIYYPGFVKDEVRNNLYQIADVAVFPSLYEPFGIVALEAMVTKTPVIVSKVGGLAEFVHDHKNGLTVKPNDPHRLAEAIINILTDKKLAVNLTDKAYEFVKKDYSWEKIARKTTKLYQKVLAEYKNTDWKYSNNKKQEDSFIYRYLLKRKYS